VARPAREIALERALRYLERCGVPPGPDVRAELEDLVAELSADGDDPTPLDRVMDRLWSRLEACRVEVPPTAPPIHRTSMGQG